MFSEWPTETVGATANADTPDQFFCSRSLVGTSTWPANAKILGGGQRCGTVNRYCGPLAAVTDSFAQLSFISEDVDAMLKRRLPPTAERSFRLIDKAESKKREKKGAEASLL